MTNARSCKEEITNDVEESTDDAIEDEGIYPLRFQTGIISAYDFRPKN